MNWDQVVSRVSPHLFKIETPQGHGTGFILHYNSNLCCVATAEHVIDHADNWKQPIKLVHHETGEHIFLKEDDRVIYRDGDKDSAVILFLKPNFKLPEVPVALLPEGNLIDIGSEIGWLGFPSVAPYTACFFSGNVSARQEFRKAYLIDGVAINGVSGGPVLYLDPTEGVQIVGAVSAYAANRATGEALPGLAIAQDVTHFHGVVSHVNSIQEASQKKAEIEHNKSSNADGENAAGS